jgi:integrase
MPKQTSAALYKRHKTRHPGITFRIKASGKRTWAVYSAGAFITVQGGEKEALALQADLRAKRHRGEHVPTPSKLTFAEVAELWFASKHRLRAWTLQNYRASLDRILLPRFGSMRVAAITVDDVAALIRDLDRQGLAPASIDNHCKPLNGVLGFAVRRRMISTNPCTLLTRDDRPRRTERKPVHVWSDEEIAALIAAAEAIYKQPASRYDYSPLLTLACFTGLRLGELLGLQWQDVDLHEGVLHVRRQYTRLGEYGPPKTEAALRRLPLPADMVAFLQAHRRSQLEGKVVPLDFDTRPVFAARGGRPLTHRNATRRGFENAAARAGIADVTFHSMRHAFASRMINRGTSSTVLAALMGHESSAITEQTYIHLFNQLRTDDAVREAMAGAS